MSILTFIGGVIGGIAFVLLMAGVIFYLAAAEQSTRSSKPSNPSNKEDQSDS